MAAFKPLVAGAFLDFTWHGLIRLMYDLDCPIKFCGASLP